MDGKKDSLAEPCFMLIGEIFELRGSKLQTCSFVSGICWLRNLAHFIVHGFSAISEV